MFQKFTTCYGWYVLGTCQQRNVWRSCVFGFELMIYFDFACRFPQCFLALFICLSSFVLLYGLDLCFLHSVSDALDSLGFAYWFCQFCHF